MDKFWKSFEIEVIKYTEGVHEIDFQIDDSFFSHFEENEIAEKGNLTARVRLNIGANLIEADFFIKGTVELVCDRSLESFDYPLDLQETIIYKFGGEEKEINEEVFMITRDTPSINVAQLIYEFILLSIPSKRIHPDYKNELDNDDPSIQGGFIILDREEESQKKENTVDPRWAALKNLKK
ncbi:YceD family protein [Algoriphagus sediminis]|uniref:DUF177 domain-containing protein n=1 Tax=Algoriphagus sediminis TaxID=3057113 RepID=A0ABT7YAF6_9BACT|nr:DUF177 domain-containing protein [Algoriphagus sediminis]MDN3203509.1 DUF177 domain-containing protein [Algoriphagus sediminis]